MLSVEARTSSSSSDLFAETCNLRPVFMHADTYSAVEKRDSIIEKHKTNIGSVTYNIDDGEAINSHGERPFVLWHKVEHTFNPNLINNQLDFLIPRSEFKKYDFHIVVNATLVFFHFMTNHQMCRLDGNCNDFCKDHLKSTHGMSCEGENVRDTSRSAFMLILDNVKIYTTNIGRSVYTKVCNWSEPSKLLVKAPERTYIEHFPGHTFYKYTNNSDFMRDSMRFQLESALYQKNWHYILNCNTKEIIGMWQYENHVDNGHVEIYDIRSLCCSQSRGNVNNKKFSPRRVKVPRSSYVDIEFRNLNEKRNVQEENVPKLDLRTIKENEVNEEESQSKKGGRLSKRIFSSSRSSSSNSGSSSARKTPDSFRRFFHDRKD